MSVCDLQLTIDSQPLSPEDHIPLLEMRYSENILEECISRWNGLDWFSAEVQRQCNDDGSLMKSQSLTIRYKNRKNPFSNVQTSDITYAEGETCPPRMEAPCDITCLSTTDSWETCEVLFDKKFQTGVSWCVTNEIMTYGSADERFRESVEDVRMVQAINSWNQFVCQALENPATTCIPTDATCFPEHCYDGGNATANGVDIIKKVVAYMKTRCANREYRIFAHRYFEMDMTQCDALCSYQTTGQTIPTAQNDTLVQGGWMPIPSLPQGLWGMPIYIAPDSCDLYNDDGTNLNPFLNADGSQYYVIIASQRSFYTGVQEFMPLTRFPATCDNPYESWQQTWISFNKILFPEEVFVLKFDIAC